MEWSGGRWGQRWLGVGREGEGRLYHDNTSTSSDMLALVIKGLNVMETAVDGLPILRLVKPAISTIHTILQSESECHNSRQVVSHVTPVTVV